MCRCRKTNELDEEKGSNNKEKRLNKHDKMILKDSMVNFIVWNI